MTLTVASLLSDVSAAMTSVIPNWEIMFTTGVVVGLAFYLVKRGLKAGR